jgi:hypothetical protein
LPGLTDAVCVRPNRFRPGQNLSKEKTNGGGGTL